MGEAERSKGTVVLAVRGSGGLAQHSAEDLMAGFWIEVEVESVGIRFRHKKKKQG